MKTCSSGRCAAQLRMVSREWSGRASTPPFPEFPERTGSRWWRRKSPRRAIGLPEERKQDHAAWGAFAALLALRSPQPDAPPYQFSRAGLQAFRTSGRIPLPQARARHTGHIPETQRTVQKILWARRRLRAVRISGRTPSPEEGSRHTGCTTQQTLFQCRNDSRY